jgi:hypothetical protein
VATESEAAEQSEQDLSEPTNAELAADAAGTADTVTVEVDRADSVVVESSDDAVAQPGDTVTVDPTEDDLIDSSDAVPADGTDVEESK